MLTTANGTQSRPRALTATEFRGIGHATRAANPPAGRSIFPPIDLVK